MALLASELQRIRAELGFPVLEVGAEPYIGVAAIFTSVIQPYLSAGATTTSTTAVTSAASPTQVTLNLASATGFSAGARLVVDVDDAQEEGICVSVSGTSATLFLQNAHSGVYPVTVEGGESIVRNVLQKIRAVEKAQGEASDSAGVKKVDEIEFFGNNGGGGSTQFSDLTRQREYWRGELARVIGLSYGSASCGSNIAVY